MPKYEFHWPESTSTHITENGITEEDVEQVIKNPDFKGFSRSSGRPLAGGYIEDGRFIICIYEIDEAEDNLIIPITAYEHEV